MIRLKSRKDHDPGEKELHLELAETGSIKVGRREGSGAGIPKGFENDWQGDRDKTAIGRILQTLGVEIKVPRK